MISFEPAQILVTRGVHLDARHAVLAPVAVPTVRLNACIDDLVLHLRRPSLRLTRASGGFAHRDRFLYASARFRRERIPKRYATSLSVDSTSAAPVD
jgi:hypothetical protein